MSIMSAGNRLITSFSSKATGCKSRLFLCVVVLAVCLFPWPLAEGCSIYNPQKKVRQGGSEYKRLIDLEGSLREKSQM